MLARTRRGTMSAIRTCGSCGTRVIPKADQTCPACGGRDLASGGAAAPAPPRVPGLTPEKRENLYRAAVLYRRYLLLIAAHLSVFLALAVVDEVLRTQGWSAASRELVGYGIFGLWIVVDLAMVVHVFLLARRVDMGPPFLWVIGMLVPYVGTIVFFAFLRSATAAFKAQGLVVGHFGPSPQGIRNGDPKVLGEIFA
jgi:hypothetical protein